MVKNPPANAGGVGLIPGSGRFSGEGNGNPLQYSCLRNPIDRESGGLQSMGSQRVVHNVATKQGFPGGLVVKNPPANAGNVGSVLGSGRSPGEGNGNPHQDSCLGKSHGQKSLAGLRSMGSQLELDFLLELYMT